MHQIAPEIQCYHQHGSTYLVLKSHVEMFVIHLIQVYFGKHEAVVVGSVQHLWTGRVIAFVHSELVREVSCGSESGRNCETLM